MSNPELLGAIALRDCLKGRHLFLFSKALEDWMANKLFKKATVDPTIAICPPLEELDDAPARNVLSLGSQVYNSLFHEQNKRSKYFEFQKRGEVRGILIKTRKGEGPFLCREGGNDIGVIERINDQENDRTLFYCAGLGALATEGCARYLAEHWDDMHRINDCKAFALYIVFPAEFNPSESRSRTDELIPTYVKQGLAK